MPDVSAIVQLEEYLELASLPLELTAPFDDSLTSAKMRELLSETVALSPLVSVVEESNPCTPSLAIRHVGTEIEVRLMGPPMGHELPSLVLALVQVGDYAPRLDEETAEAVRRLEGREFVIYMSLTCQNYPTVVQVLDTISVLNPRVRHMAAEGGAFKDEVGTLGIKAVPTIYKDGQLFGQDRVDVADFVAHLDFEVGACIVEALDAKDPFEILVVGDGPAGATAVVYSVCEALRIGLVATRFGEQVLDTMAIENSVSVPHTEGPRPGATPEGYARPHDMDITTGVKVSALHLADEGGLIIVDTKSGGTSRTRSVVLTTGVYYRTMDVLDEEECRNKGMTFCPYYDGPLFEDRSATVIGGGNSDIEVAIDLAQIASHMTVVKFLDVLRTDAVLVNTLRFLPNVDIPTSTRVVEIVDDGSQMIGLNIKDHISRQVRHLDLGGIFVQIGFLPDTGWLDDVIERSRADKTVVGQRGATSPPGVFTASNYANTPYEQIVIPLGSRATAALSAFDHLIRSQEEADTPATVTLRA